MLASPDGRIELSRDPNEHHARPAIDPLFRTDALAFGSRAIGVILTGMLDDGTAGLQAIKRGGGLAVVQDPAGALEPSMPASARAHVHVDHCAPLQQLPQVLIGPIAERARDGHEEDAQMTTIELEHDLFCGKAERSSLCVALANHRH